MSEDIAIALPVYYIVEKEIVIKFENLEEMISFYKTYIEPHSNKPTFDNDTLREIFKTHHYVSLRQQSWLTLEQVIEDPEKYKPELVWSCRALMPHIQLWVQSALIMQELGLEF